jgi:hypothetical protein
MGHDNLTIVASDGEARKRGTENGTQLRTRSDRKIRRNIKTAELDSSFLEYLNSMESLAQSSAY